MMRLPALRLKFPVGEVRASPASLEVSRSTAPAPPTAWLRPPGLPQRFCRPALAAAVLATLVGCGGAPGLDDGRMAVLTHTLSTGQRLELSFRDRLDRPGVEILKELVPRLAEAAASFCGEMDGVRPASCENAVYFSLQHRIRPGASTKVEDHLTRITMSHSMLDRIENEDELRFIIAHELAHAILGHRSRSRYAKLDRERDADRLAMYIIARAGYSLAPDQYGALLARVGARRDPAHPSADERTRLFRSTTSVVKGQLDRGLAPMPPEPLATRFIEGLASLRSEGASAA